MVCHKTEGRAHHAAAIRFVPCPLRCDFPHGYATAGPKRRKVLRTTINDRGEEVTEQVWEEEDSQEASPRGQLDGQPEAASAANSPAAAARPASKSPDKPVQDSALKEQPGL